MALALRLNDDELSKLGVDPDSPVSLFWAKFAERRPTAVPDMETVCSKIAQTIEHDYCAESVEDMPKLLTEDQLQQVMAKAGGKPTWSGLITYILGPFKPSLAAGVNNITPPSAVHLRPTCAGPAPFEAAHEPLQAPPPPVVFAPPIKAEPTWPCLPLGAMMEAEGTLQDDIIPEYVFDAVFECDDVEVQQLTAKDVTAVLNAYTHFMITHHKQPAGDKKMRAWHGKQLKRRLKHLPDHGKGKPGPMRKWSDLLEERKRNNGRKAKVRGTTLTLTSAAPTIALSCRSRDLLHAERSVRPTGSQTLPGVTFTSTEVEENAGVAVMIDCGLVPVIDDKIKRNTQRLELLPPPPAPALTDITNGAKNTPPTPAATALTQEERDRKMKAEAAARALAALDGEDVNDEMPVSGGADPPDGAPDKDDLSDKAPARAPSAKERRAAVAAEKKKEKEARAAEAKAQKEAKKAEKAAAKASGGGRKRKHVEVCAA